MSRLMTKQMGCYWIVTFARRFIQKEEGANRQTIVSLDERRMARSFRHFHQQRLSVTGLHSALACILVCQPDLLHEGPQLIHIFLAWGPLYP